MQPAREHHRAVCDHDRSGSGEGTLAPQDTGKAAHEHVLWCWQRGVPEREHGDHARCCHYFESDRCWLGRLRDTVLENQAAMRTPPERRRPHGREGQWSNTRTSCEGASFHNTPSDAQCFYKRFCSL